MRQALAAGARLFLLARVVAAGAERHAVHGLGGFEAGIGLQGSEAEFAEEFHVLVGAGIGGGYARRLLTTVDGPPMAAAVAAPAHTAGLAEPLTAREIEILRLVAAGMQNQQIADHLVISLATVKRHIANLYGKLGVDHRTAALVRAADLGLL